MALNQDQQDFGMNAGANEAPNFSTRFLQGPFDTFQGQQGLFDTDRPDSFNFNTSGVTDAGDGRFFWPMQSAGTRFNFERDIKHDDLLSWLGPALFAGGIAGAAGAGVGALAEGGGGAVAGAEGVGTLSPGGFSADPSFLSTKDMLFPGLAGPTGGFTPAPGFASTASFLSPSTASFSPSGDVNFPSNSGGSFADTLAGEGGGVGSSLAEMMNNPNLTSFLEPGNFGFSSSFGGSPFSLTPGGVGAEGGNFWDTLKRLYKQSAPYRGAFDVGRGVYGLFNSRGMGQLAAPGKAAAAELARLTNDPSAITSLPGYQQLQAERMKAVTREMAARGYNMSGNEKIALANTGGQLFNDFRNQELSRLSQVANTAMPPEVARTQLQGNSVNSIMQGLMKMFA